MALEWPLVGRAEELDFIDVACGRNGRGLVLAGRAGVGKSRLASAAADRAADRGQPVRRVISTVSSRDIPLGAFGAFVPPEPAAPEERLAATRERLLRGAAARPLVVIDDAHLLDAFSAALVTQLVVNGDARVIVTVRSGEPAPDAVTALWRDGVLPRLDVQALSRFEVGDLLESALLGQVDSVVADRLFAMTQGNVLYLRQVVDGEHDAGRLVEQHGVWRWTGTPTMSEGLVELVMARMGALAPGVRDVLDALALAEPIAIEPLGRVTSLADIEAAEDLGLVSVQRAEDVLITRAAHPLFTESRRASMGTVRARRLRARLVEALRDDTDITGVLRRALLMVDADIAGDPVLLTQGAEIAAKLSDGALVQRLARAAVAAGGGYRAQSVLAFTVAWAGGDPVAADAELEKLESLASSEAERARAVVVRATYLMNVAGRPEPALDLLRDADDLVRTNPTVAAVAALVAAGQAIPDAAAAAIRVLEDPAADDEAVVLAATAYATAASFAGAIREPDDVLERGTTAAAGAAELSSFGIATAAMYVHGLRVSGSVPAAMRLAGEWEAALRGHEPASLFGDVMRGIADLAAGRVASAVRALRQARAGLEGYGDMGGWRHASLIATVQSLSALGDAPGARAALLDLEDHRHPSMRIFDPGTLLARAWVAAAEGSLAEGQSLALQAADLAEEYEQWGDAVLAVQDAVRFGRRGVHARALGFAARAPGPRTDVVCAFAAAMDAEDGSALRAVADRFETMGDLLTASDAAAWASDAFGRAGRAGSALEARTRLQRLAAACEGVRTPAMIHASQPEVLTAREREIARLAAQGWTNHAIADRLVVSVRTVEGHLYRINQKLGIASRDDLAQFLG